jgi:Animal haem peroxidase
MVLFNRESSIAEGYGRMFPGLPPFALDDRRLTALAEEMVKPTRVRAHSNLPAGYTYFGQLIAHDLSRMQARQNRSLPRFWLDTLYGYAIEKWRHLYTQNQSGDRVFLVSRGASPSGTVSKELDLPRNKAGHPSIPDERDDFHFIISQLHLAFMLLHNRLTRDLREKFPDKSSIWIFDASRRELCWLYQWLIVNDFLPRLCDKSILGRICTSPKATISAVARFFPRNNRKLSYEFALAGYRFGHSLVRPAYRLNDSLWSGPIFRPLGQTQYNADWRGHRKLPIKWSVQWNLFFDFGNSNPQLACRMRTSIAAGLGELPKFAVADDRERQNIVNLAERTLRAGKEAGLPSGQDVARYMLENICPKIDLPPIDVVDPGKHHPLWYYVLKEASELGGGLRLGPVGSWIVVATIASLLVADDSAYVHEHDWLPQLPIEGKAFELRDLIRHTGLPVTREDWARYVEGCTPAWC